MLSVNMGSLWGDDIEQIIKGISEAAVNIKKFIESDEETVELYCDLFGDIEAVCLFWTGNTYVGSRKDEKLENAFQDFFQAFMKLLLLMKKSEIDVVKNGASEFLYRGDAYRYLGKNKPFNGTVKPEYNNIYVSWSKEPKNHYFESKLYGTMTWMSCTIPEPLYGIDIDALGYSRADEKEVVFPTIKECINEIKFIWEESNE